MKQQKFENLKSKKSYGGSLLKKRKARQSGRPLSVKSTMHLVLRSTKAKDRWSFNTVNNQKAINEILNKFSKKYFIKILKLAIVGNHIHLHVKLPQRQVYYSFIRAISSAIMMAVTGACRWRPLSSLCQGRFWDQRPFSRIICGFKDALKLSHYIELNQLEACGMNKLQARLFLAWRSDC